MKEIVFVNTKEIGHLWHAEKFKIKGVDKLWNKYNKSNELDALNHILDNYYIISMTHYA